MPHTTNLFFRNDTIFGVCEAIEQDFGLSANWIRLPLAAGLLWNVGAMVAIYLGLGLVVLASRLIFPDRKVAATAAPATPQNIPADPDTSDDLPLAA